MNQGMITRKCAELVRLEMRLHVLSNTWPIGIKSLDDANDAKRVELKSHIETVMSEIEAMREVSK